jgi:predicted RND superfamily exporter protein
MNVTPSSSSAVSARQLDEFDKRSGSRLERLLFNHRAWILLLCAAITVFLGLQLPRLQLNANFQRMIPTGHPFIKNFLAHEEDLAGQGNVVRVVVENTAGSIIDAAYLAELQKISDEIYLLPGVDRGNMMSLWTSNMRWRGINEEGLEEGAVIDQGYDGSPQALALVAQNIQRSGEIGRIAAPDFRSSMVVVPLMDINNETGERLDYVDFSRRLEQVRARHEAGNLRIHVIGFAKLVGDLIDGVGQVLIFFGVAIAVAVAMVYAYTRCVRSTAVVITSSMVAIVWLLGLLPLLGFELDPYTVLVPFLVFAIGMSHGAQKMNGILQDIGRGIHSLIAARYTFRRLFMAGLVALLCDAVGFAVLLIIDIGVIRQLAIIASIGVAILVFTNLILLPIVLSYTGVSLSAAQRSLRPENAEARGEPASFIWRWLEKFTRRDMAAGAILVSVILALGGLFIAQRLQIGDLDPGAPELRTDSRYNRDNAYITAHYGATSDVFIVMVKSDAGQCLNYPLLQRIEGLEWQLRRLPGVASTDSFASAAAFLTSLFSEGNVKWTALVANQPVINSLTKYVPPALVNQPCSMSMLRVFLSDHKAATLDRVTQTVEAFARQNDSENGRFLLAAGNAGIEAATNMVVKKANYEMLALVYLAVIVLCLVTFRSWRAVLCAVLPLALTSILAEALMVLLGIGVKVATLPVVALGVGIGVDYALYVLSIMLFHIRLGDSLAVAYRRSLMFTGRVVLFTGLTLALGVATWSLSPIKFQADMGILLGFMFIVNMLGALVLLPALACFLLQPKRGTPVVRASTEETDAVSAGSHRVSIHTRSADDFRRDGGAGVPMPGEDIPATAKP